MHIVESAEIGLNSLMSMCPSAAVAYEARCAPQRLPSPRYDVSKCAAFVAWSSVVHTLVDIPSFANFVAWFARALRLLR